MLSNRGFIAVALLSVGCSRAPNQHQAKARSPGGSSANSQVFATNRFSQISAASTSSKPSPFPKAQLQDPLRAGAANDRPLVISSETKAMRAPIKPFVPVVVQNLAPLPQDTILPSPPVFTRPSASVASNLLLGHELSCCMAIATYEMAKPSRLKRVIKTVPGLRRITRDSDIGEGFVPPHPLDKITIVLPPGASPAAIEQKGMDVKASINEFGRVIRVELLEPKDEELVNLAAYAANGWRFTPARRNDITVASLVILHFKFN